MPFMAKIKTEKGWLSSTTPHSLLLTLKGKRMRRQRRLVAVALCRRLLEEMIDPESRRAVEVAERYADGLPDADEVEAAYPDACRAASRRMEACQSAAEGDSARAWSVWRLAYAAQLTCAPHGLSELAGQLLKRAIRLGTEYEEQERKAQCTRIRDIFGNPFRPRPVIPSAWLSWNGGLIPKLAQTIYDERELPAGTLDSSRLAILADALEEAGCVNADILGHCRWPDEHVRGCWLIDLLLGKTWQPRTGRS
jgi:hypothetical protein